MVAASGLPPDESCQPDVQTLEADTALLCFSTVYLQVGGQTAHVMAIPVRLCMFPCMFLMPLLLYSVCEMLFKDGIFINIYIYISFSIKVHCFLLPGI